MIDEATKAAKRTRAEAFQRRWEAALLMNGHTNASLAAALGASGSQLINNWKNRGRVGQDSLPLVRELLKRTSMDWLQEDVGDPERVTYVNDHSVNHDFGQSYATRLAPAILAQAVRVVEAEEHLNGRNPPLKHAMLLLQYCDRISAGEKVADLIAEIAEGQ